MKHVVSVSIGAKSRDHKAEVRFLDEDYRIERIGTDGDVKRAIEIVRELDGTIDAFGMGGMTVHLTGPKNRLYTVRSSVPFSKAAKQTPMVDGCKLKNVLERYAVRSLERDMGVQIAGKKVFMVCALDRFGMAEELENHHGVMMYGDAMMGLGLNWPIRSMKQLMVVASLLLPLASQFPYQWLYPIGESQHERVKKYQQYFQEADIIAGDYLYIARYMPDDLSGKIVLTNTVTPGDIQELREHKLSVLVTSTPEFNGRSFGTNMLEAMMVAKLGRRPEEISAGDYEDLIKQMPRMHRVVRFD